MKRLYKAVCAVIEAKAQMYRQPEPEEPRETDLGSQVESPDQLQREELDQDAHRDGLGRIGFTEGVASTGGCRRRSPATGRFIVPRHPEDL